MALRDSNQLRHGKSLKIPQSANALLRPPAGLPKFSSYCVLYRCHDGRQGTISRALCQPPAHSACTGAHHCIECLVPVSSRRAVTPHRRLTIVSRSSGPWPVSRGQSSVLARPVCSLSGVCHLVRDVLLLL